MDAMDKIMMFVDSFTANRRKITPEKWTESELFGGKNNHFLFLAFGIFLFNIFGKPRYFCIYNGG